MVLYFERHPLICFWVSQKFVQWAISDASVFPLMTRKAFCSSSYFFKMSCGSTAPQLLIMCQTASYVLFLVYCECLYYFWPEWVNMEANYFPNLILTVIIGNPQLELIACVFSSILTAFWMLSLLGRRVSLRSLIPTLYVTKVRLANCHSAAGYQLHL